MSLLLDSPVHPSDFNVRILHKTNTASVTVALQVSKSGHVTLFKLCSIFFKIVSAVVDHFAFLYQDLNQLLNF